MQFFKYQGAGNDFIVLDARLANAPARSLTTEQIRQLCDRRFGIGADGLMLLLNHPDYDFEMVYYNSNGHLGSMCGNGGRCIVAFAKLLGVQPTLDRSAMTYRFLAADGLHEAHLIDKDEVRLSMQNVLTIKQLNDYDFILDTGSPHYVRLVETVSTASFLERAKAIRYSDQFAKKGINVNFVAFQNGQIHIRTYERGVEGETLACGTGVTAAAICWAVGLKLPDNSCFEYVIEAIGGTLTVRAQLNILRTGYIATHIWLSGPATLVYTGQYPL